MRTNIKIEVVWGVIVLLLVAGGTLMAEPFVNPPELIHPNWITPFPYQRNILVGFDTDPHAWPDHISSPTPNARKALTPLVVHHEGTDDGRLYPSDWLGGYVQPPTGGSSRWLATDSETGTNRKGILALDGQANSSFILTWHIDNWDRPWAVKNFFVEAEYHTTGNVGLDKLISSNGQDELLKPRYEMLPDGWIRWSSWATLAPNPMWEEMVNTIAFENPGTVLIDFMHIATECVPEPAASSLLGLGILGLFAMAWRRYMG